MNYNNSSSNRRYSQPRRNRIYSNSQTYNNALMLHFENINNLTNIINDSHEILLEYNSNSIIEPIRPSSQRSQRIFRNNNDTIDFLNDLDNNISHIFRFDTLFSQNSIINPRNNNDLSYNIKDISCTNIELLDISNTDVDIFNILNYENIENPINDICPITRDRFHSIQNVLMIRKCKHIFNKSALTRWIENNNTCPTCRINIK
tara:strand:+ start:1452 stop:2063 length:612 start_codon:yes stop_codon:yes gene_type:complete